MHHSAMHLAFSQLELRIAADTAKRSMAAKRRMSGEAESLCAGKPVPPFGFAGRMAE